MIVKGRITQKQPTSTGNSTTPITSIAINVVSEKNRVNIMKAISSGNYGVASKLRYGFVNVALVAEV